MRFWSRLLFWAMVAGWAHSVFAQTPRFNDSNWEGKLQVKIPELVRYVYGVRESSMKGVQLGNLPGRSGSPAKRPLA